MTLLCNPLEAQYTGLKNIPGTHCAMAPASGFILSRQFNGFVNKEKNAMVLISVFPQPLDSSVASLRSKYERSGELKDFKVTQVVPSAGKGFWMEGTQQVRDTLKRRYMLIFGDVSRSILVNASVPDKEEKTKEAIRIMMLSTIYDSAMKEDASELLDFTLDLQATCLKEVRYTKGGMLYSCDGRFPTSHVDGVTLMAGSSVKPKRIEDRRAYMLNRLGNMPGVDSLISYKTDTVVIDKIPGYQISAIARSKTGKEMQVYMVLLFESDTQYFIIGGSCTGNYEQRMADMRKAAASFKRKRKR